MMGILKTLAVLAAFFLAVSDASACSGCGPRIFQYDYPFAKFWILIFFVWIPLYLIFLRKTEPKGGKGFFSVKVQFALVLCFFVSMIFEIVAMVSCLTSKNVFFEVLLFGSSMMFYILLIAIPLFLCVSLLLGRNGAPVFGSKRMFYLQTATFGAMLLSVVLGYATRGNHPFEKARRISCMSTLKQLGLSLNQYAEDNGGFYPERDGADGMNLLFKTNYMPDRKLFTCPSSMTENVNMLEVVKEENLSYVYKSAGRADGARKPVMWDKPGNHKNYGNVMYTDGHVEGFSGADWMRKAGVEK